MYYFLLWLAIFFSLGVEVILVSMFIDTFFFVEKRIRAEVDKLF